MNYSLSACQTIRRKGNKTSVFFPLFLGLLLFLIPQSAFSQFTDIYFDHISREQGLSQSIVKCIMQDSRGLMYFGTEDGLNIYDGYKFTIMRNNPNDTNSLSYNDITAIYEDHDKIIWIGTFNAGLNRYDPSTSRITRFPFNPLDANSISNSNVNDIAEDKKGNLWIATDNGLCMLEKGVTGAKPYRITRYSSDPKSPGTVSNNRVLSLLSDRTGALWAGTEAGVDKISIGGAPPSFSHVYAGDMAPSSGHVRAIFEDSRGDIWFGTENGLVRLRSSERSSQNPVFIYYRNNHKNNNSLSNNDIFALNEDADGMIWIGTNGGGVDLLDAKKGKFSHFRHDRFDPTSLSYNEIRSVYRNRSGIMWVGTYGSGISKVSRAGGQFYHYYYRPDDPNSLSHAIVWSIYEDKDSILWIGTHDGLDRLDRKTNTYTHYRNIPGDAKSLSNNIVRVITDDGAGNLWIGTHGGGINIFNKKTGKSRTLRHDPGNPQSLAFDQIRPVFRDRSGTMWIGTYGQGLDRYETSEGTFMHYKNVIGNPESLSNDFVRIIFEDRKGNLWIGTEGGGINKFDRKTGKFKSYLTNPSDQNTLSSNHIFTIYEDKDGYLWLGTWGGGLNKFDPVKEKFQRFNESNGLPSNSIYGILEDNSGNLWMSTNAGLSKFDPRNETFTNYTVKDGLQDNEFNGGSYYMSPGGELFFGGINGFNSFYPGRIKSNRHVPPVLITSFSKLNKEVDLGRPVSELKEIELSYQDYVFSFEFAGLDYMAPEKNKYAYRMDGFDKNWIFVDASKRFAYYTNLSPGRYTFMVKASNSDGIWNDKGALVSVIITPPFYRTWWFIALAFIVLFLLAYYLYRWRLKNNAMKTELKAAHEAQMSIMPHSDPHFNCLDVSGTCIPASEVGGDFFDYFRRNNHASIMGVVIGDVSGKAMKAAMTAVLASGMMTPDITAAEDIKTIFTRVNKALYIKTDKRVFVAACIMLIDVEENKITYINAGNASPLLRSDGTVCSLSSSAPRFPLGLIDDVQYEETTVEFNKGDVLILTTDGITEAQSKSKELYGMERIKTILSMPEIELQSASEIKDRIIRDVNNFCTDGSPQDDMTVIIIKRV
ncbi:MAG TPA: two-component regulator propeller domain-containing protein [Ignavibacteriales bacterium]|nr:two-component regulator propeller domain-containing protein [Ignavibacteriales bacterium]